MKLPPLVESADLVPRYAPLPAYPAKVLLEAGVEVVANAAVVGAPPAAVAANRKSTGNHARPIPVRKNASPSPFSIGDILDVFTVFL